MMWKNVLASLKVKDNLGMMSKQMMDKWQYVKSSQSLIYMYMYMVKKTQTTCQRLELQTFVVSTVKDTIATNYILEEQAYFCSLKKWTVPSFVVSKVKDATCQKSTFIVWKREDYKLFVVYEVKYVWLFCSLCSVLVKFVIQVWLL